MKRSARHQEIESERKFEWMTMQVEVSIVFVHDICLFSYACFFHILYCWNLWHCFKYLGYCMWPLECVKMLFIRVCKYRRHRVIPVESQREIHWNGLAFCSFLLLLLILFRFFSSPTTVPETQSHHLISDASESFSFCSIRILKSTWFHIKQSQKHLSDNLQSND